MNAIFRDCIDDFTVIYLDDILIFSDSREDHLHHLRLVLKRLKENHLYVGQKKHELMRQETEFLGLIVGTGGISVGEDRKKLIKEWPVPTMVTELRSFLELVQIFRRFVKEFSRIAAPLTNLTRKNSSIANWNNECTSAFRSLKEVLITAPVMQAPDWSRPFRCHTDASQLAVGGTLAQIGANGDEYVISYFSKRLSAAEENYSANDRELLALVYFLQRFRCYVEGCAFEVLTDNQVLKYFFSKTNLSRREARWLDFLGQFGISHLTLVKGKIHVLGDVPSRAPHCLINNHDLEEKTPNINTINTNYVVSAQVSLPERFKDNYTDDATFRDVYQMMNY